MIDFEELKKKGLKPATGVYHEILQKISIYISWFFLKISFFTPNRITLLWFILQLFASSLLIKGDYYLSLIGVTLFQFAKLLDSVDGQIARVKNNKSLLGVYLDSMAHNIANSFFLICLGTGVYIHSGKMIYLIIGIIGAGTYCYGKLAIVNPLWFKDQSSKHFILERFNEETKFKKILWVYDLWKIQYPFSVVFWGIFFGMPHITLTIYSGLYTIDFIRRIVIVSLRIKSIQNMGDKVTEINSKHIQNAVTQWNKEVNSQEWNNFYDYAALESKGLRGKIHNSRKEKIIQLFDSLKIKEGSKILELGYGAGIISAEIYKRGYDITGIDLSLEFQKIASERCKKIKNGGKFEFKIGNVQKLEFIDSSFDCIIGSAFLHYIEDPVQCLKEAYRVLKPGGYLILGQRNMYSASQFDLPFGPLRIFYYLFSRTNWETSYKKFTTKKRLMSYERMVAMFKKTDLNILHFEGAGFYNRTNFISKILAKLENNKKERFANNLIFVLKKEIKR